MKICRISDLIKDKITGLFEVSKEEYFNFETQTRIQELELQLQEIELIRSEITRTQAKNLLALRIKSIRSKIKRLEYGL